MFGIPTEAENSSLSWTIEKIVIVNKTVMPLQPLLRPPESAVM